MHNDLLGSVRRTLRILDYLAQTPGSSSPRAIALAVNSNISTVYHVLNTLRTDGYVKRDEATGRYALGSKIAPLGHAFLRTLSPPPQVRAVLHNLSETLQTNAYLTTVRDGELIVSDIVEHGRSLPKEPYRGYSAHFHALSMGKAILAYCPPSFVQAHFEAQPPVPLTKRTLKNMDEVAEELERVRGQGFAESLEEFIEGRCAVAAPLFEGEGKVYGAIAACLPVKRYLEVRGDMRETILRAADQATRYLAGEKRRCG